MSAEIDRDLSIAWHVAAFTKTKRLRSLRSYLRRPGRPGRSGPVEMTEEERLEVVAAAQKFADRLNNVGGDE